MTIDIERLRRDMKNEGYGAYYGGGFGGGLMSAFAIDRASDAEVVNAARQMGIDLRRYVD